jgi:hypothetical protein
LKNEKQNLINMKTLKSIGAILTGFLAAAILSIISDLVMGKLGLMSMDTFKESPTWVILMVTIYRFIFNVLGCYIAASLAPDRPMRHAMIIGVIGLVLSIIGSIIMWEHAVPWYNISIILMALPSAWIGGKLRTK